MPSKEIAFSCPAAAGRLFVFLPCLQWTENFNVAFSLSMNNQEGEFHEKNHREKGLCG